MNLAFRLGSLVGAVPDVDVDRGRDALVLALVPQRERGQGDV